MVEGEKQRRREAIGVKRRFLALMMTTVMVSANLLTACGGPSREGDGRERIVVFNYGDYIDVDLIAQFEEETGIQVAYEEFLTPEAMYTKYKNGTVDYDLICCSDYMLDKMIQEEEVVPVDFGKMEYADNIGDTYWELSRSFDPDNQYSIPYYYSIITTSIYY